MTNVRQQSLSLCAVRAVQVCLLLLALVAPAASAVSLADRSPFAQGLWWQPSRSGEGFEIWNTADMAAAIWYTYDDNGRPTWYLAAGTRANLGQQPWPLLQFRWSSGAVSAPVVVGSLRIDVRHHEALDVTWVLGQNAGTRTLEPMIFSGVVNEVDRSGSWFDPGNSGWGLSIVEQGDARVGVLYTYDTTGAPTWALGARRGSGAMQVHTYRGACPGCAYLPASATPAGTLDFEPQSEANATLRSGLTLAMAAGVRIDGARVMQLSRPASWRAADRQLAHFGDAASLRAYLVAGMASLPPVAAVAFSAPPPPTAYSTTNLQESGVDEADLVKSDGRYIYTFAHTSSGVRRSAIRVAEVGNDGATFGLRGEVSLGGGPGVPIASAGLFQHGARLVAVTGTQAAAVGGFVWARSSAWARGSTIVEVFDTTAPTALRAIWRAEIDGHVLTSRRIGDRVYIVSRFVPYVPGFTYGASHPSTIADNERLLAAATLADLIPNVRVNGGAPAPAIAPEAVHVPPQGTRKPLANMILVTAIDLATPRIAQTLAIVGSVETVYASPTGLYVASLRYEVRDDYGFAVPIEPLAPLTDVHRIALRQDALTVEGSGTLEGYLGSDVDKAPFRLSEHAGRLRAVTSSTTMWGSQRNRLTILEPSNVSPGLLKTIAYLPNPRRPETLGKPNEILYGTRFAGERLYAVTFKSIDPLYVVDLSDSRDPRIAGALEVPGFSDYLHPLPNGLLLGFGKDTRPADVAGDGQFAWYQGLQLSLFDVSQASRPREIQRVVMGKRGSESALLKNHHAFSMLSLPDGSQSIAIPAGIHDGASPGPYDWAVHPWDHSGLLRFELRGATAADARLVQLPTLVTHRSSFPSSPSVDAAKIDARSILLRSGTVYVGNGEFWHQDSQGATRGPY